MNLGNLPRLAAALLFAGGSFASVPLVAAAAPFDAASANNQFGLELYQQLAATRSDKNLVLSPYSISTALALANAGAAGQTRAELTRALHLPSDEAAIQSSFTSLRLALETAAQKTVESQPNRQRWDPDAGIIEWHLANRLFGQGDYSFRESYLSLAQTGYGAGLEPLDFRSDAARARGTINAWVEAQTRQRIRDLVPVDGVNSTTRLVLVNALYLKAPWSMRFEPQFTSAQAFHVSATHAPAVPTMAATRTLPYLHRSGFTTVALDYIGGDLQFLIFLPDRGGNLPSVAAKLTPTFLRTCAQLREDERHTYVSLSLPKFRVAGPTVPLRPELKKLGINAAFDTPHGSADFSLIAPRRAADALFVREVFHQTFLALDESGTEAAAATAVVMMTGSMQAPKPIEVRVDRPFLFAIQHIPSGACLFLGHIVDPR